LALDRDDDQEIISRRTFERPQPRLFGVEQWIVVERVASACQADANLDVCTWHIPDLPEMFYCPVAIGGHRTFAADATEETVIVDIIEEPVLGVMVVTEFESVRTIELEAPSPQPEGE
jgi:hypothetical protein